MTTFILNPYEADLDLTNKEDRKLFLDACKGLPDKDKFDGKRENFGNFAKLLEQQLNSTRTMEAMVVNTEWTTGTRTPDASGTVNIFKSNQATREEVETHCVLVWSNSTFGNNTPRYFADFQATPSNTTELNSLRNQRKLKHVIMGSKIWNSFTSSFQIDIQGSKDSYMREQEKDGPLLWDFIRRRTNPTTTVGASKLKDELESKTVADFGFNVIAYNTWFQDTKDEIIKEEGEGYNEYLRSLFRGYLAAKNEEFIQTINAEKRNWMQGKVAANYSFLDLMDVGRIAYNNLVDDESWGTGTSEKKDTSADEKQFLTLATKLEQLEEKLTSFNPSRAGGGAHDGDDFTKMKGWRYYNPDKARTKVINGRTMTWCSNDCHRRPMWCGRKNCLNRADYAEKKNKEAGDGSKDKPQKGGIPKDFRMALAALTTTEDLEALEEQYFSVKE